MNRHFYVWPLFLLLWAAGCRPKLTYPSKSEATRQACESDCLEVWKTCQSRTCDADREKCAQRCRDYGGLRGGGVPTIQF